MARKLESRDNQEPTVYDESKPPDTNDRVPLDRRSYLTLGGLTIAALSATTSVEALTSTTTRHGIEFEQTKNAVSDLGLDPTGETPIDETIQDVADGVLIQFPSGSYRIGADPVDRSSRDETRGLEGIGENVSFVVSRDTENFLLEWTGMDGIYIDNIDFEQHLPSACLGLRLSGDRVVVTDVDVLGGCSNSGGGLPLVSHSTPNSDGTSLIENVVARAGCRERPALGRPGIYVERSHRGTLKIRHCDFREFPTTAIHADGHAGRVHVFDSYLENNAAAVRLSCAGSSVERSEIVVDDIPFPSHPGIDNNPFRLHGISAETAVTGNGGRTSSGIRIEDTMFRIETVPDSYPAIVVPAVGSALDIVDCEILYNNDSPHPVILYRAPGESTGVPSGPLRMRDTKIVGDGAVGTVIDADTATDTRITDSELSMPHGRDGLKLHKSADYTIGRTDITVSGQSVVFDDHS